MGKLGFHGEEYDLLWILPDGSRWGAVAISAKDQVGEWLENNETAPDIEVKNMPGRINKGRDQQLERAIEGLLRSY